MDKDSELSNKHQMSMSAREKKISDAEKKRIEDNKKL